MPPAARLTDMHVCPMVTGIVPHVGGPILPPCAPQVLIGFLPAARVGDMLTCVGPPDVIAKGSMTVMIGYMPAARTGDHAGRRIPVPSGAPVRVGRQPPSEVRLADDPMLSNLHFSVECADTGCTVRDLGSRFGTLLNGHKVVEAALKNGDEIKAGRT